MKVSDFFVRLRVNTNSWILVDKNELSAGSGLVLAALELGLLVSWETSVEWDHNLRNTQCNKIVLVNPN